MIDTSKDLAPAAAGNTPGLPPFFHLVFVAIALLLTVVSYRFEVAAYHALLGNVGTQPVLRGWSFDMAQAMAFGFGGAKVAAVYILVEMQRRRFLNGIRVWSLRALLISLSLFATLLVVSMSTISPYADQQVAALRNDIQTRYEAELRDARALAGSKIETIADTLAVHEEVENTHYATTSAKYEAGRDKERETGIGTRYNDYQRLLNEENARHETALADMRADAETKVGEVEDAYAARVAEIKDSMATAFDAIDYDAVAASSEAQNPALNRTAFVIRGIVPDWVRVDTVTLTTGLALLMCFAVEFAPLFIFSAFFRSMFKAQPAPVRGSASTDGVEGQSAPITVDPEGLFDDARIAPPAPATPPAPEVPHVPTPAAGPGTAVNGKDRPI